MKKLFLLLLLLLAFVACSDDDNEPNREIILSSYIKKTDNSKYEDFPNNATVRYYLHEGNIDVTDEILDNPSIGAKYTSNAKLQAFVKFIDKGTYTVIVHAYCTYTAIGMPISHSGDAYSTIKYPDELGKIFYFDFSRSKETYTSDGVTYVIKY